MIPESTLNCFINNDWLMVSCMYIFWLSEGWRKFRLDLNNLNVFKMNQNYLYKHDFTKNTAVVVHLLKPKINMTFMLMFAESALISWITFCFTFGLIFMSIFFLCVCGMLYPYCKARFLCNKHRWCFSNQRLSEICIFRHFYILCDNWQLCFFFSFSFIWPSKQNWLPNHIYLLKANVIG